MEVLKGFLNKIVMKKKVITIEEQCDDCCGNGFHIEDSCDHQGEHVQREYPCETCGGSGLKE